jgi:outer membrane protein OmpA-like peptidoglycan-associated protein
MLRVALALFIIAGSFSVTRHPSWATTVVVQEHPSPQPSPPPQNPKTGPDAGEPTYASQQNPKDNSTYATDKPLPTGTNEGFWGHLNPLARKRWVNRQVVPVKDRLNELDQLSAKNAKDMKDLDARSTAGIRKAQDTSDGANQLATTANTQAGQASELAKQASTRTDNLDTTVANLDQYSPIADTEIRFRPGQTTLNARAKEALDDVATKLRGQKGLLVEVQGYSRVRGQTGIANSQHMADAVVRYLVVEHNIPVYRIYRVALGNAPLEFGGNSSTGAASGGSLVHVRLMHNSLADLGSPSWGTPK